MSKVEWRIFKRIPSNAFVEEPFSYFPSSSSTPSSTSSTSFTSSTSSTSSSTSTSASCTSSNPIQEKESGDNNNNKEGASSNCTISPDLTQEPSEKSKENQERKRESNIILDMMSIYKNRGEQRDDSRREQCCDAYFSSILSDRLAGHFHLSWPFNDIERREDVYILMNDQIGVKKRGEKKQLELKVCLNRHKVPIEFRRERMRITSTEEIFMEKAKEEQSSVMNENENQVQASTKKIKITNTNNPRLSEEEEEEIHKNAFGSLPLSSDKYSPVDSTNCHKRESIVSLELFLEEWEKYKIRKQKIQKKKKQLKNKLREHNVFNADVKRLIKQWKEVAVKKARRKSTIRWKDGEYICVEETALSVFLVVPSNENEILKEGEELNSINPDETDEGEEREEEDEDEEGDGNEDKKGNTENHLHSKWFSWCVEGKKECVQDFLLHHEIGHKLCTLAGEQDVFNMGYPGWIASLYTSSSFYI